MHKEYVTNTFLYYCEKCNDVIDIGYTGCIHISENIISISHSTYFMHLHAPKKRKKIYVDKNIQSEKLLYSMTQNETMQELVLVRYR